MGRAVGSILQAGATVAATAIGGPVGLGLGAVLYAGGYALSQLGRSRPTDRPAECALKDDRTLSGTAVTWAEPHAQVYR